MDDPTIDDVCALLGPDATSKLTAEDREAIAGLLRVRALVPEQRPYQKGALTRRINDIVGYRTGREIALSATELWWLWRRQQRAEAQSYEKIKVYVD